MNRLRHATSRQALLPWATGLLLWVGFTHGARADAPSASSLTDEALIGIKFDQNVGRQVTVSLPFRDEDGRAVVLGDYLGRDPVILILGYYDCPMLCNHVLNGLVECLHELKPQAADQFELVFVSVDPGENPALAKGKKATYLKRYGRAGAEDRWHFLTGQSPAIARLAEETGFRYAYDPQIEEYAHPSGIILLTPRGRVAHYQFGVAFSAGELVANLRDAADERVGSVIEQIILLCFHYGPLRGRYGELVMNVVRASAVVTLLGLGGIMVCVRQRRRKLVRKSSSPEKSQADWRGKDGAP